MLAATGWASGVAGLPLGRITLSTWVLGELRSDASWVESLHWQSVLHCHIGMGGSGLH